MNIDRFFGIASAVFSIIGTCVIWIDAQEVNKKIINLLLDVACKIGMWVDDPISKEKLEEVNARVVKSGRLNIRGFILLIIGFILQLVSLFL